MDDPTVVAGVPVDENDETAVAWWWWVVLISIATISFWFQAVLTEERFVPALNVISTIFQIPDDVAGATLMAAGASSPELFSSLVALFVTHSALGLGTIVGSEIFNQLVICAGAIWAADSKNGSLKLNAAILTREVGFYALAIGTLYVALRDKRPVPGDVEDHIFISFPEALLVFSGYILYVVVCANMVAIVHFCRTRFGWFLDDDDQDEVSIRSSGIITDTTRSHTYGTIVNQSTFTAQVSFGQTNPSIHEGLPFLQHDALDKSNDDDDDDDELLQVYQTASGEPSDALEQVGQLFGQQSVSDIFGSIRDLVGNLRPSQRPADLYKVQVRKATSTAASPRNLLQVQQEAGSVECFLWQRSYFYTKSQFSNRAWHLRWFTLTPQGVSSVTDPLQKDHNLIIYPKFDRLEVDEQRKVIRLVPRLNKETATKQRDFYFLAPSIKILQLTVLMLERYNASKDDEETATKTGTKEAPKEEGSHFADFESLLEPPPAGASYILWAIFVVLYPFKAAMHFTVPDVRVLDSRGNPTATVGTAFGASIMCLLWLIVGSYAMVASLEALAELLDIPDAVVGVTVSAVGTSLPNYVASKVAAEQGFGNMAVSNAFGSNTFNIMIGLGLPWALYTSVGLGFQPYSGLRDDGILESVMILAGVLALFIVVVVRNHCVLLPWHATLFATVYVLFLVYEIGKVYLL